MSVTKTRNRGVDDQMKVAGRGRVIGALKETVRVIAREEDKLAAIDDFFVWVEGEREIRGTIDERKSTWEGGTKLAT